jgi:hypothetical protein
MPRVIACLFAAEVVLVGLHLLGPPLPEFAERGGSTDYLWDLDGEANLPAWFSSIQLAAIGFLLFGFAASRTERNSETGVLGLAGAGFLLLSLDEQITLHEKVGRGFEELFGGRGETAFDVTGPCVLIGIPLFLAAFIAAGYALRGLFAGRRRVAMLVNGGGAVYLSSFAGIELVTNFVSFERGTVVAEEAGEMAGATLLLWGVYELLRSHRVRLFASIEQRAPSPPYR